MSTDKIKAPPAVPGWAKQQMMNETPPPAKPIVAPEDVPALKKAMAAGELGPDWQKTAKLGALMDAVGLGENSIPIDPTDEVAAAPPLVVAAATGEEPPAPASDLIDADAHSGEPQPPKVARPRPAVRLVDTNPKVVEAWKTAFVEYPEVDVRCASMTEQLVDVWVTPTNSKGNMSGGLDAVISNRFPGIESAVKEAIREKHSGKLQVGRATCVEIEGVEAPRFLISAATMEGETDDLRRTKNTALAMAAAFQAIYEADAGLDGDRAITVALPGLGMGTGKVDPAMGAQLMLVSYRLFRRGHFPNYDEMLAKLNEELAFADLHEVAAV